MGINWDFLTGIAEKHALDFVTLFGSTARGILGRDVDLAVMPRAPLDDLSSQEELYEDLCTALHPAVVDLTFLPNASWLLNWQVARDGICLLGGPVFERFREAAYWRKADSQSWSRAERQYLAKFLLGEVKMDRDLVCRHLTQMTQYVSELEMVLRHGQEEFESNPLLLRTAERDTELLVEFAAKINTEIGLDKGIPPSDYYSSFFALVPDWLDRDLATELAKLARLRDMLIHQYENVHPHQVYAAVVRGAPLWRAYLKLISEKI